MGLPVASAVRSAAPRGPVLAICESAALSAGKKRSAPTTYRLNPEVVNAAATDQEQAKDSNGESTGHVSKLPACSPREQEEAQNEEKNTE